MVLVKQNLPLKEIEQFCKSWSIQQLWLFGSVLREDFNEESDIDILFSFAEGEIYSFSDLDIMQRELELIFGRKVDIVDKKAVDESPNYIRRREILQTAELIYAAR
jgi:uncharacterized protein